MQRIAALIRSWFFLHLLCLAALVLQPTVPAIILGRYSKTSAVLLAIFIVLTPVIKFGSSWLARRIQNGHLILSQRQSVALLFILAGLVFGFWLVNTGPTSSYIIVRWYLTFVAFTLALWVLQYIPDMADRGASRITAGLVIGSCFLLVALATRFPGMLWTDEGFDTSAALSLFQEHQLVATILRPVNGMVYSSVYIVLGVWYNLVGVTLSNGRIFILLVGFASLFFIYKTARLFYSRWAAWLSVLLGAYALIAINYVRSDIGVAFYLAVAFYCFALSQRRKSLWLHFVAGLALGFSLDGHPSAYRFGLAFAVGYLLEYGRLLRERRRFFPYWPLVLLGIGELVGLAAYTGLFLYLAPVSFGDKLRTPQLVFDPRLMPGLLLDQFNSALNLTPLLLGTALLGLFIALRRRHALDRQIIVTLVVSAILFALLYGYYRDYYLAHMFTLLALLAAGVFGKLETDFALDKRQIVRIALTALVTIWCIGLLTEQILNMNSRNYDQALAVADQIRMVVPKQEIFVGIDPFYLRMYDYPSFVEFNSGSALALKDGIDEQAAWKKLEPTTVALVYGYPIPMPASLIDYVIAKHFQRVRCWTTDQLGKVELFMQHIPTDITVIDSCQPLP